MLIDFIRIDKVLRYVLVWAAACLTGCDLEPAASHNATPNVQPAPPSPAAIEFPDLPRPQQLEPGVNLYSVTLDGVNDALWIYLPESKVAEEVPEDSLPCVLIAPAGSYGFLGMFLSESDRPEHLPYVREGYAVVAYAFDGYANPQEESTQAVTQAAKRYMQTDGSFKNAKTALDYVLETIPAIDERRIFAVGHSSAATIALCNAAKEPRIRGCAAYAPGWTDLESQLHPESVRLLSDQIPGYKAFLKRNSPSTYSAELDVPLFVFQAVDDAMVPMQQTSSFVEEVAKSNPHVTYVKANRGGHYDSMLHEGVPKAIDWMDNIAIEDEPSE